MAFLFKQVQTTPLDSVKDAVFDFIVVGSGTETDCGNIELLKKLSSEYTNDGLESRCKRLFES